MIRLVSHYFLSLRYVSEVHVPILGAAFVAFTRSTMWAPVKQTTMCQELIEDVS